INIHPTYLETCGGVACALGTAGAADVADVAVIVLASVIPQIPIPPIGLDPVSLGRRGLAVRNGCGPALAPQLGGTGPTVAALASVLPEGSPYKAKPDLAPLLGSSYVVPRGPGSSDARDALGICAERDLGAPLFLADGAAVVGINSNRTAIAAAAPGAA